MKTAGILVLLSGLGAIGGGISFFITVARRVSEARHIRTVPLSAGPLVKTESFPVSRDRKCQLIAEFHRSSKFFEGLDSSTLSYRVLDADGSVLVAETVETGRLGRLTNEWTGDVQLRHSSPKFDPPRSGRLSIEATLVNGGKFSATYTSSELKLYDTVSEHTKRVVYGTALSLVGAILALLGGGLVFLGIIDRRRSRAV